MRKAFKIAVNAFTVLVVLFTVCVMAFTIVSVNTVNKTDAKLFGYKAYIVLSDSMSDVFKAGDMVISREVDTDTLKEGDIISFKSIDPSNYGEVVTHKIRAVTSYEGKKAFITYGTTTGSDDSFPAVEDQVVGQYKTSLPKMGTFFQFLKSVPGYITVILIPFLVLLTLQAIKFFRLLKTYKSEQQKEIDHERAEVAEEKRKAQEMMQELEQLKQQLTAEQQPIVTKTAKVAATVGAFEKSDVQPKPEDSNTPEMSDITEK